MNSFKKDYKRYKVLRWVTCMENAKYSETVCFACFQISGWIAEQTFLTPFSSHFSLPSQIKEWWNYRADRWCHKVNACKIIRSNLPEIMQLKVLLWFINMYSIKNIAALKPRDIQQYSSIHRCPNGAVFESTQLFGWQRHTHDINVIFHFAPSRVAMCEH